VPSARAAFRVALPLLALGALGANAFLQGTATAPELVLAGQGRGSVTASLVGQVVTDGHPQVVVLSLPKARRPLAPVTRAAAPHVSRPRPVRATVTAPAPAAAPRPKPVRTVSDSYPYASDTTGASDEWGFTKRQCVSYVAWRLAGAGRPLDNATQHWNSALDWDDTARRLGYRVSSRPSVGAVAQWNAGERSSYWSPGATRSDGTYVAGSVGHVAWVVDVYDDGSVLVAQYNGTVDRGFSTMHVTAPRYLSL
jgi:surface antigen